MSKFDLEKRAEELHEQLIHGDISPTQAMLQLARELAEAIAAECEATNHLGSQAAAIARSFASPRTREEVMVEAMKEADLLLRDMGVGDTAPTRIKIKRALDWRQP